MAVTGGETGKGIDKDGKHEHSKSSVRDSPNN